MADTFEQPKDSIVEAVVNKFQERSRLGIEKYGTTLDREDLDALDWIRHAQEEHMDAILYLERLQKEIMRERRAFGEQMYTDANTIYTLKNDRLFFLQLFLIMSFFFWVPRIYYRFF